eukprot:8304790-Lingulodinium_polyedra.AAC.1
MAPSDRVDLHQVHVRLPPLLYSLSPIPRPRPPTPHPLDVDGRVVDRVMEIAGDAGRKRIVGCAVLQR